MMDTVFGTRMLIEKNNISKAELDKITLPEIADGEVLLAVDVVALTSNNITYAATGSSFGYWSFFPAPQDYGIVPVWGFANVVASKAEGISAGERFYGYWPLASHVVCKTAQINVSGFSDPSPHRQVMGSFYNRFMRTTSDPAYSAKQEDLIALFRPLFMTGFLIEQFLTQNDYFGAEQIIISSASSKTAMAAAFNLKLTAKPALKIIGLTSAENIDFVKSLGIYNDVHSYADVASLNSTMPTAFIDFAGQANVTQNIHTHFADSLKHSAIIGMTHWQEPRGGENPLPGVKPILFFAPSVAEAALKTMGPTQFGAISAAAWMRFMPFVQEHIHIVSLSGMAAARDTYQSMAGGTIKARDGVVLKLQG
jgi:Protein of unknown function (DUF2855)